MPTNLPKEDIAHEFGHVALGHGLVTKRVTIGGYIKGELEAWQWAAKKWKKQELPEKSWIVERKRWVFQVAAQAILEFYLTVEDALAITKEEIKKLKMKPLTQSEVKWLTSRLKVIRKDAVGELKNLGKDKDWVKKVEREANK
jgi:3-oxoacyl-[acyl-carrier-protein] synthase III